LQAGQLDDLRGQFSQPLIREVKFCPPFSGGSFNRLEQFFFVH